MTLDIAAIKARAAEATEGPWDWRGKNGQLWSKNADGLLIHPILMPIHEYECGVDIDARDENMEFIAHARQDVPALIAALEESEAARVKAEMERDALAKDHWILSEQALHCCVGHASRQNITEAMNFLADLANIAMTRRTLDASK